MMGMIGMKKVLLIGYGNPGRLDDGLGPALAAAFESGEGDAPTGLTVESDYQLSIEDAAQVAEHDVVIFADASVDGREPFFFRALAAADPPGLGFSSHAAQPDGVLGLAQTLFGAKAEAYVLGIRGYEFNEFGERLSDRARANLAAAAAFLRGLIETGEFRDAVTDADAATPTWE